MENCYEEEEISRYLDGELNPRQARLIEEHLESCPGCQALARRIEDTGIALKSYWQKAVSPSLARGTDCPEEGVLVAFVDGSIREEEERKEIAVHLAGCDYCGRIVAEASRAVDLAVAAETANLAPVPGRLNRRIEERFFPSESISLGEIKVSLSEIWKAFSLSLNPAQVAYPIALAFQRMAMVAEEPENFSERSAPDLSSVEDEQLEMENSREIRMPTQEASPPLDKRSRQSSASHQSDSRKRNTPRGLSWTFEGGEMNVVVEMAVSETEDVECRVNLTNCYGYPLAGIPLRLEKDGKKVWSHCTELKKEAVFPYVTRGRYRLTIDHERDYYLELDIR